MGCAGRKKKNWTGRVIHGMKLLGPSKKMAGNDVLWWCECLACSRFSLWRPHSLYVKKVAMCKYCHILQRRNPKPRLGDRFGLLRVIDPTPHPWRKPTGAYHLHYRCHCDCGRFCWVTASKLRECLAKGTRTSCGRCGIVRTMKKKEYSNRCCKYCQKQFKPVRSTQQFCTQSCKHAFRRSLIPARPCSFCGTPFSGKRSDSLYCSKVCGDRVRGRRACAYVGPAERECVHCKKRFLAGRPDKLYCSKDCGNRCRIRRFSQKHAELKALQQFIKLGQLLSPESGE